MDNSSHDGHPHAPRSAWWESLLFDIRMIGPSPSPSSSSRRVASRVASTSPRVDLNSAIVGRYRWTSNQTVTSTAARNNGTTPNHRSRSHVRSGNSSGKSQERQQSITSCVTDGQRWAVAIGVMTSTTTEHVNEQYPNHQCPNEQQQQPGSHDTIADDLPVATRMIKKSSRSGTSLSPSSQSSRSQHDDDDHPTTSVSSTAYTFCSIADLAQGLRATEVCRWPLVLGTEDGWSGVPGKHDKACIPTMVVPPNQWQLTGDAEHRLCVANSLGQVEVIT